ncbi:MAG: HAD family hydrolase [Eubacteriaceae bacterium]|jgi:cation-transporting ATPase E
MCSAWKDDKELPVGIRPLYAVLLSDNIRKNAAQTLDYFRKQGVDVKVISGDHVGTVSMIARQAGLKNWQTAVDLSDFDEDADYDRLSRDYAVFARVTPRQKQLLVQALKKPAIR